MFFMTKPVLKNLFSKSATRLYPIEVREPFEDARGALTNKIEDCIFCGMCSMKCPAQCITVDKKEATWKLDAMVCIACGICVDNCPTNCLSQERKYRAPMAERLEIAMKGELKRKPVKKAAPKAEAPVEAKAEPKAEAKEDPEPKAEAKAEAPKAEAKAPAKKAPAKKKASKKGGKKK